MKWDEINNKFEMMLKNCLNDTRSKWNVHDGQLNDDKKNVSLFLNLISIWILRLWEIFCCESLLWQNLSDCTWWWADWSARWYCWCVALPRRHYYSFKFIYSIMTDMICDDVISRHVYGIAFISLRVKKKRNFLVSFILSCDWCHTKLKQKTSTDGSEQKISPIECDS